MKAIRVNEHGGPEVLSCEEVDTPRMSEEEVLVKSSRLASILSTPTSAVVSIKSLSHRPRS